MRKEQIQRFVQNVEAELEKARSESRQYQQALQEQHHQFRRYEGKCQAEFQYRAENEIKRNREEMSAQQTHTQSQMNQDKDLTARSRDQVQQYDEQIFSGDLRDKRSI